MRRITLPEDLVKPSTKYNDYAHPLDCVEAQAHFKVEVIRHRAWHETFNKASGFSPRTSAAQATWAHGPVKWFGTDEDVI